MNKNKKNLLYQLQEQIIEDKFINKILKSIKFKLKKFLNQSLNYFPKKYLNNKRSKYKKYTFIFDALNQNVL